MVGGWGGMQALSVHVRVDEDSNVHLTQSLTLVLQGTSPMISHTAAPSDWTISSLLVSAFSTLNPLNPEP